MFSSIQVCCFIIIIKGVFINESNGKLRVVLSSKDSSNENDLVAVSFGRALPRTKTIFVVTVEESVVSIYINGILDTMISKPERFQESNINNDKHAVFIAGHPSYLFSCKALFEISKLQILNSSMEKNEIESFSAKNDEIVEPGYILMGCTSCSLKTVSNS